VRSTTFLFITLCTSIQNFGVFCFQTELVEMVGAVTSRRLESRTRPRVCCTAVPRCATVHAYRGRPATPGPSAASLGKFPSATWSPRPRRPTARRIAHRSATVLHLCVRTNRCHSLYRGLKARVLLHNEGTVTLHVPRAIKRSS
jgi:hypothetical protein